LDSTGQNKQFGHLSDDELVVRAKSGDSEAFSLLIQRHQGMVFSIIMRQVRDREVAKDLAQESFIRAYKYLDSFRGDSKFSTWLTRIALNRTSSWYSSEQYIVSTRKIASSKNFFENLAMPDSDSLEQEIKLKLLTAALGKLSPDYREVIHLRTVEQKSYKEIAEILEIPLGTVKSRMNMGVIKLRRSLGGKY